MGAPGGKCFSLFSSAVKITKAGWYITKDRSSFSSPFQGRRLGGFISLTSGENHIADGVMRAGLCVKVTPWLD